ncbi:DAK2 domain-containing protein [Streptomyces nogalater]
MATVFLDGVGGTSGPLFGLLLTELALAAVGPVLDVTALRAGLTGGLAAVQRVGEARPGTRPSWMPCIRRARRCACVRSGPEAGWPSPMRRAPHGRVRLTARLRAPRPGQLRRRAGRGVPDPGAVGVGLLLSSAGAVVTELPPFVADPAPEQPG